MTHLFDDLAREIARSTSRRDVLKRLGVGLAGLLWSAIGVRKAGAAVTCGTCQACNLDALICGLPCSPASAGQTLCMMADRDGSYLRLAYNLAQRGFVSVGPSDSVMVYQAGRVLTSGLATNFFSSSIPGQTATLRFTVNPTGDKSVIALVSQNSATIYALTVDPSGRVIQTVATRSSSSPASRVQELPGTAWQSDSRVPTASAPIHDHHVGIALAPEGCNELFDVGCRSTALGSVACWFACQPTCVELKSPNAIAACEIVASTVCGFVSEGVCNSARNRICSCPFNQQLCHGTCCDPCMDCINDACHANAVCAEHGLLCCNNICCASGLICSAGVCTSPNAGCAGATCSTFVPCSTNADCVCVTIAEGGGLCVPGSTSCAGLALCNSASCPPGTLCAIGTCCGDSVCVPTSLECPPQAASLSSSSVTIHGGPTIGHR